jgi:hypothetical protein
VPSEGRGNFLNTVIPPQTAHTTEGRNTLSALTPAPVRMKMRSVGETVRSRDMSYFAQHCARKQTNLHASKVAFSHGLESLRKLGIIRRK